MNEEKVTELLMELSSKISAMQKDIEGIKTEMHANYIRSDENDTATRELVEERTKWAANRQDSIKAEMQGAIEVNKKAIELHNKQIELLDNRIKELENKDKNKVYSRWEKITEKLFWVVVAVIFAAVFKYLNFVPPAPL